MTYLRLSNPGEIDTRGIFTFGLSVKEIDAPIGYFGTGIKHGLAVLLRMGQEVILHAGETKYRFSTREITFRNKPIQMIFMNDQQLPFTLDLGKNWKLWMAYRELYCNMLDERGSFELVDTIPEPEPGRTSFYLGGQDILNVHHGRSNYFLDSKPLWAGAEVEIHAKQDNGSTLFYRGVSIGELNYETHFTYNILKSCTLTEDRTLQYSWEAQWAIRDGLSDCPEDDILSKALLAPADSFEGRIEWPIDRTYGSAFLSFCENNQNNKRLSPFARSAFRFSRGQQVGYSELTLNSVQSITLARAVKGLKMAGVPLDNYPIIVTKDLPPNILGQAKDDTIFLSVALFNLHGTKFIANTIFEEYVHLAFGCYDETRQMQDVLIGEYISLIETHVMKEPF